MDNFHFVGNKVDSAAPVQQAAPQAEQVSHVQAVPLRGSIQTAPVLISRASRGVLEPRQRLALWKFKALGRRCQTRASAHLNDDHRHQDILDAQRDIGVYIFMPLNCRWLRL